MKENDETRIKNALIAAKTLAALQDERRLSALRSTGSLAREVDPGSVRRAAQDLLAPMLSKAGASVDRFEDARQRYQKALERAAADARGAAITQSVEGKLRLEEILADHGKALDAVTAGSDAQRFLLNVPFSIIPTSGLANISSGDQPARSFAKFTLHSSRSTGYEEVAFHFIWGNTGNTVAVIDVNAYLVLNGHVQAGSGGGLFPSILSGERYSQLDMHARVAITLWGSQPPMSPMQQADQDVLAVALRSNTGEWGSVGGIEVNNIFRGYDLSHTLLFVPPHTNVVFQVLATVGYSNADGTVDLDFASGGFEVACPGVLITVRS